jgi:hypothetical protein
VSDDLDAGSGLMACTLQSLIIIIITDLDLEFGHGFKLTIFFKVFSFFQMNKESNGRATQRSEEQHPMVSLGVLSSQKKNQDAMVLELTVNNQTFFGFLLSI